MSKLEQEKNKINLSNLFGLLGNEKIYIDKINFNKFIGVLENLKNK